MEKKNKIITIVLVILALYIIGNIILAIQSSNQSENGLPIGGYYIGETLNYEDIDITIAGVTCKKVESANSYYYGLNKIRIYFTYKNNKTKNFDVDPDDIKIKTESDGIEYNSGAFSAYEDLVDMLFKIESLVPGEQKYYYVDFHTPYTLDQKRFIVVFDWGLWSHEEEYYLCLRDGSNYIAIPDKTEREKDVLNSVISFQSNLYNYFRRTTYEKINSSMSYADIQKLMFELEQTFNNGSADIEILLDSSQGKYQPVWNITVFRNGETYYLYYIEVKFSSSDRAERATFGSYIIN